MSVNIALRDFKTNSGAVNFPMLFAVPEVDRLKNMAKNDFDGTLGILVVSITQAVESMNLSRPMTASQILDLAETLIDTSDEDNLALEDVLLFLQKLVRGQYGPLYEGMDIPKFMGHFEKYRDERYVAIKRIREEESVQHKSFLVNDTIQDMFPDSFKEQMHQAKIEDLKRKKE